jgi:putative metalloprotease
MPERKGRIMIRRFLLAGGVCALLLSGCENADLGRVADAGRDAVKALTLSDREMQEIAARSVESSDKKHALAPPESKYAQRLKSLVGQNFPAAPRRYTFGVYLSPEVNAFAMADGTIRIYGGLMDLLDDGEVRFVIGHEMGHVESNHIREKIRLAYAASAVRKGIASQNNAAGDVAGSVLGDLAESLVNAQFSQVEEKEADDFGLAFLKREKGEPRAAVTALKKLAALSPGHSFLSSHPDPERRAERLLAQLEGRAVPIEEKKRSLLGAIGAFLESNIPFLHGQLKKWIPGLTGGNPAG